jgi:chorismate mutase
MSALTAARQDPVLQELRERVSELDREILDAVNRRLEVVEEIARHKRESGLPIHDPHREESMLRALQQANRGKLTAEGVAELQAALLYLTKRQLGIAAAASR